MAAFLAAVALSASSSGGGEIDCLPTRIACSLGYADVYWSTDTRP